MNTNRQTAIKESKMKITTPKVIRVAGLSAIASGIIFAGIQPIHPPDVLASVNTSAFIIITSLKTVMCLFGLFGIAGLRQASGRDRLAGSDRLYRAHHLLCSPNVLCIRRTPDPAAVGDRGAGVCGEQLGDGPVGPAAR